MNEIVNAEYRVVQERTLPVIASEILQIERNVYAVAMDGAIQIGRKLQEAKDMVEYGQWETWCRDNLNYSHSQATRFMKIATEFGDKNTPYSKIATSQEVSISKALELLKVPEEQVETFVEEHDIEEISVRELREEIKKLKSEKQDLQTEKEAAYETAAKAEAELTTIRNAKIEASHQAEEYAKACEELRSQLEAEKNKSPDVSDTEAVKKLQAKLTKAKKKLEKAKCEFKTLEESFEQAQATAKDEAAKSFERGEAHGRQLAGETEAQLRSENELLRKKLENSADPVKAKLGVLGNQLQNIFAECMEIVDSMNGEDRSKGINGMKTIVNRMKERLD